ncbi:hypothetical protein GCM10007962_15780 [Yeosuana aromativorans]|uniref:Cytochrome c domain-containing protein n=1 Tax=Yeosuana aromativorans TaxID=288019 RepID=A0A8J3BNT1_9FLAO|nr:hypothetical protein [Yeosuana aromativorans]GGK22460.1 hypothetical protein GCM10007962_15780 [Yeosuana aromativorans]
MKKLLKIVLVSSLSLLSFSCYYDEFPQAVEVVIPPDQTISFASDITPIFATYNCAQCHKPSGQSPNLTAGNEYSSLVPAYVSAGNATGSRLYIQLADKGHRNVDAESLALIKKWIEDGAENN